MNADIPLQALQEVGVAGDATHAEARRIVILETLAQIQP